MRVDKRGRNARTLHLVEQLADLSQVGDGRSVRVQGAFPRSTLRKRGNLNRLSSRGMHLVVQATSDGVLPELDDLMRKGAP